MLSKNHKEINKKNHIFFVDRSKKVRSVEPQWKLKELGWKIPLAVVLLLDMLTLSGES